MITYAQRVAACRHQIGGRLHNGLNVQIGHVCGRCLQPMPLGPANDRGVPEVEMRLAERLAGVADRWSSEQYHDAHARFFAEWMVRR